MGRLGDVLEVLFGPDDRFQTIRATVRHWLDYDLARKVGGQGRAVLGRKKDDMGSEPGPPKSSTSTRTIWLSRPACARIEERREVDGNIETTLTVTDGVRRWERDTEGHVEINEGERQSRTASGSNAIDINVDRHFNPAQIRLFFQELILESLGPVRSAGRDCVRVRAVPRPGARLWPHWLPKEANEYEFHVDPERGVLLSIISRNGGEVLQVCEVLEVAFDEPLESSLFTYNPAPGEQVGSKIPAVERLTLAAAVSRMPFTVLVPTRVPDAEHSHFEIMYHPPRRQRGRARLALMYRGSEAYDHLWVDEGDRPDPGLDNFEWERIVVEGAIQKDLRISDPGDPTGMRIVAFEQQGTHVKIRSDLDRAKLINVATSFTSVPGTATV